MTSALSAPAPHTTVQSFLIVGTDAVLAARPATAVQLAHACAAIGFDVVVPTTWGDEIIARAVAERACDAETPVVQCSCPLVARRFAEFAGVLDGMVMHFVPPPIAAARYLRAVYRAHALRITYAGDCPLSAVDGIDEQLSCAALFERLAQSDVRVDAQPTEYDSVIPPDRRRHFSQPGGLPTRQALSRFGTQLDVVELSTGDVSAEVAQHLLSGERAILDIAVAVGCRCSGAAGPDSFGARERVSTIEPPRSPAPVVDHDVSVSVDWHAGHVGPPSVPVIAVAEPADANGAPHEEDAALVTADVGAKRRSPPGSTRAVMGTMPLARGDSGRQLPRLYVARRRSSPRGMRQSAVRREIPSASPAPESPKRWLLIAVAGLIAGVLITLALAAAR